MAVTFLTNEDKTIIDGQINQLSEEVGVFSPDQFEGTDSEKLQACFDELKDSGGIISINREYTLTNNLVISHNSNKSNRIFVRGDGKYAKISFGEYSIVDNADTSADGGILFDGIECVGSGTMLDANGLIRMHFNNCTINGFNHIMYNNDGYIQTLHFSNCLIRNITDVAIKTIATNETTAGNAGCLYDVKITNCVIEWCKGLLEASSIHGCSISFNCIEGFSGVPIKVRYLSRGFDICSNYFEANDTSGSGINIDLYSMWHEGAITIQNNYFSQPNTDVGAIRLPRKYLVGGSAITGNAIWPRTSYLIAIPDNVQEELNIYAFANIGEISGDATKISQLGPEDIATVDKVLAALPTWDGGEY